MRVKALPPAPGDLGAIRDAWAAVPRVPKPEADCCARLVDRLGLAGRDVAREWLTLLLGLGLVEETRHGIARSGGADPDHIDLGGAFVDGVFGGRETLDVLAGADGPVAADEAFASIAEAIPTWERARDPDGWYDRWRERVERVLDWLVLLGFARRTDRGYLRE